MAYDPTIPQPIPSPSASQPAILENFTTLNAMLNVNHVTTPFVNPVVGEEGKHLYIQMPDYGSFPANTANDILLFTRTSVFSGNPELWMSKTVQVDDGETTTTYPITLGSATAQGYSYLPSGLLIKWGSATISAADSASPSIVLTYSGALPSFSKQLWVSVIPFENPLDTGDPNIVCSVSDISDPTKVLYRQWRRTSGGTAGGNGKSYIAYSLALGLP